MIGQDGATQFRTLLFDSILHLQYLVGFYPVVYTNTIDGTLPEEDRIGGCQW